MHTIQMHLSQKQKTFSEFFSVFFKSALNFEHFQKKMTLIAYVFPKLPTTKNVLRQMSKSSRFREPVDRDMVSGRSTDSILMRAHLSSGVITVKVMELQKSL